MMIYETNCNQLSIDEWTMLMKHARSCSYRLLVQRIRKELPDLYESLALQYPNPYAGQCRQTLTHYILVHSIPTRMQDNAGKHSPIISWYTLPSSILSESKKLPS